MRDVVRFLCILISFIYIYLMYVGHWPFDIHCTYIWVYIFWCMLFTYLCMCCFFSLFMHMILIYCTQSFFFFFSCFTLRCHDEFCLKCFKNTGCQSLLAMNSLFAKFFKSLCYDRFYCIQQVSMSWVIYNFSYMFICLLWFCHELPKGEIVRTYWFNVRNICQNKIC